MIKRIAAIALSTIALASVAGAETKIIFNSFFPPKHPFAATVLPAWVKDVASASNNRLIIDIPPNTLAPPPRIIDAVAQGMADAGYIYQGLVPNRIRLTQLAELPWGTTTARASSIALWRTYQKYFAQANEYKDVHLLALFTSPKSDIFSMKSPIEATKDLKGIRMWALPGAAAKLMERAGAGVVATPAVRAPEIISAGTVDAFVGFTVSDAVFGLNVIRFAKSMTAIPGGINAASFAMFINKKKWESLAKDDQEVLTKLGAESFAERLKAWDETYDAALKELPKRDVKVVSASPEFIAHLKQLSKPLEDEWIADAGRLGVDGQAALQFYRAESQRLAQ